MQTQRWAMKCFASLTVGRVCICCDFTWFCIFSKKWWARLSLWRKFMPNQISHSYIRLKSISQENLPTFYHCATFTRTRWNFLPRERTSKWKGLKQLYTYVGCFASMKIWWPGFISTCHHYIHMKYSSFRSKLNKIVGRAKVGEEWKLDLVLLEIVRILGFAYCER